MAKQLVTNLDTKKYSRYFKAFGDPSRLKILGLLAAAELTVTEIVKAVGLSQPTVSRHLAVLRDADLVVDRRDGQRVYYLLNKNSVTSCCSGLCNCLEIPVKVEIKEIKKKKRKK